MRNKKKSNPPVYTTGEEIFNSISHGVGIVFSIAALVLMIIFAVKSGTRFSLFSAIIYGISLIILYSMSMVYHIVQNKAAKKVMRIFDHCSIFTLIAGTYTPYLLLVLGGRLGWIMFAIIWAMAVIGVILNAVNLERFKIFSMICYIIMGWAIVFTVKPISAVISSLGVLWLVIGGVFYTVGILFYLLKKYKYMHSVWHLFVLGGSICHYFSILLYVIIK